MKLKTAFYIAFAALLCLATSMCSSATDSSDAAKTSTESASKGTGINWYGYDAGMAAGKNEGKKILINFYADWCTYCKQMDRETFSKSDVATYINENFIPIKLNADVEKQLASEFRVNGLPTTWFMDMEGQKIVSLPGYLDPDMFLAYLKYIESDSYLKIPFRTYMSKK